MAGPRQEYFRMFALYNRWANRRLYGVAARLTPEQLGQDRGAFFRSVLGTLNHLLVVDRSWLSRLEGVSPRELKLDAIIHEDFAALRAARRAEDQKIAEFVFGLSEERLAGSLDYTTTRGEAQAQPMVDVLAHLFNHQAHHRGQAHDLLCQLLGREQAPALDLLAYQRFVAASDKP